MEYRVEVHDVSLVLGGHVILEDISMNLKPGKIYGLIGRNGCGKTMLMKSICGFVHPTAGSVRVSGKLIGKDCDFPSDTGIIIETPEFLPYHSGYRNLKDLADLRGKVPARKIRETITKVGLDPDLKLPVRKYSLGMRQRLGLAQAMMEDPALLILDEPMNGLDEEGVRDVRGYLLELKEQGKTIMIASHSAEDIAVLCDKTFQLAHGKIVCVAGED